MKQLLRICLTGAFFLLFEGLLSPMLADNGKSDKEILVLNSINFNLPWARNFYWYVHDVLQEQGITARAESLSVPALQDTMEVNAVIEHLRQKYPLPPAAVVIIGDPGWIVCRPLFDDLWKDVPVIITNSRDRLPATLDILLSHASLNETNSVPAQEWRKGYNLTTLKQHYYVKETVELIYSLIPDMDRLAFISDDRYISEETRGDVKEAVEKHFPNLPLELLSTTHLSTEMLLDTLRSYKANTGIIYYSWFESHNKEVIIIFLIIFRRLSPILRPLPCSCFLPKTCPIILLQEAITFLQNHSAIPYLKLLTVCCMENRRRTFPKV